MCTDAYLTGYLALVREMDRDVMLIWGQWKAGGKSEGMEKWNWTWRRPCGGNSGGLFCSGDECATCWKTCDRMSNGGGDQMEQDDAGVDVDVDVDV